MTRPAKSQSTDSNPTASKPTALSESDADALIIKTQRQLAAGTFDATDEWLLVQLVEGFNDKRGMKRFAFAEILDQVGKPATPALIEGLANHENPAVRRACAKTITLIADRRTIPTLVHSLLHDEDTVVQGSVVGALAVMGEEAALVLIDIIGSSDYPDSAKGLATWGLSFVGVAGKTHLYESLNAEKEEVRSAVVGALTSLVQEESDEQALTAILRALKDDSAMVRSEAAAALGKLSDATVIPQLASVLSDADSDVRKTAAMAMMKIGDGSAIAPIQAALKQETDPAIQPVFKLAISQLEKKQEEEDDGWD
ncbi:MAG: HEAT repeat domain-containing protein [Cyanobacteria bacterium J06598_1]